MTRHQSVLARLGEHPWADENPIRRSGRLHPIFVSLISLASWYTSRRCACTVTPRFSLIQSFTKFTEHVCNARCTMDEVNLENNAPTASTMPVNPWRD